MAKDLGPCNVCGRTVAAEDQLRCVRIERQPVYGRIGDPGYGAGRPTGWTETSTATCGECALAAMRRDSMGSLT